MECVNVYLVRHSRIIYTDLYFMIDLKHTVTFCDQFNPNPTQIILFERNEQKRTGKIAVKDVIYSSA